MNSNGAGTNQEVVEKKIIAVVDDSPADLLVAGLLVRKEGFEIRTFEVFSTLYQFLRMERERVAMILLDVNMPGLSGIDMLKRLRREAWLKSLPILMMTGDSTPDTVKAAISNGANDYIVKPLDPNTFEAKIDRVLQRKAGKQGAEWVADKLEQILDSRVNLQIGGSIASIGDLSLTIRTSISIFVGSCFVMDTDIFKEIGLTSVTLKVESCVEDPLAESFVLHCAIVGLSATDCQKVRIFCRSLLKNGFREAV